MIKKIKVYVDWDESYPVYSVSRKSSQPEEGVVELTPVQLKRFLKIQKDYDSFQGTISKLLDKSQGLPL